MEISHKLLNNTILRRINRIKRLSDRYRTSVEFRLKDISHDKPVGLEIKGYKLIITLQYTFENFQLINKALIKKFSKIDSFSSFKRLVESENILDHRGWHNLGLIFDQNSTDWRSTISAIKIKNLPQYTTYISCTTHRIVPSTSFLCFEFFLDNSFHIDLYKNFYSEEDVIVTSEDFSLKRTSIQGKSSGDKFNEALNTKIEYFQDWILNFLKIEKNIFLSMNSIFETSLKKISPTRPTEEIVKRNLPFLFSQSFSLYNSTCFNNGKEYFYIENLKDIRVLNFEENDTNDEHTDKYLIKSLMILISINSYKKELEIIIENNLKIKKKPNLLEVKNKILKANKLEFQIRRLFQEIDLYSENKFILHALQTYDFKTYGLHERQYHLEFKHSVEFHSKLLIKNSESLKKLLEIEFNSITTETNYLLQNGMKWLTFATLVLAFVSLVITAMSTDTEKVKQRWVNIKDYSNSLSIIKDK